MSKFTINRGTDFTINVVYKVNNVASTLVGSTLRFTVKSAEYDTDWDDSSAIIQKDVVAHTDAVNGISEIAIVPNDTYNLTPGTFYYDIKIKNAAGKVYKLDEGTIKLDGSPTNRLT